MAGISIDYKKLDSLLKDFFILTDIRITYWTPNGKRCLSGAESTDSAFCSRVKSVPSLAAACNACEERAIQRAKEQKSAHVWRCHAGMNEYIYPVIKDDVLLGYFMIGQFRLTGETAPPFDHDFVEKMTLEREALMALYQQLPCIPDEKIQAARRLLHTISGYLYYKNLVQRREVPLVAQVERYISGHLTQPITIDDICGALTVSRSKLCHEVRREKGMTVVEMVNQARIEMVARRLERGESVKSAAFASGFSSVSYCSRVFSQYMGISPQRYQMDKENQRTTL